MKPKSSKPQRRQSAVVQSVPDQPVASDAPRVQPTKREIRAANLFGFKLEPAPSGVKYFKWKPVVQDEVRVTVWTVLVFMCILAAVFFTVHVGRESAAKFFVAEFGHATACFVALVFTICAVALTLSQIYGHTTHYVHPPSQRHVIKILLMVPVYSISSWIALVFVHLAAYIEFIRGCYEAYVIYEFMLLLTEYLGGHHGVAATMTTKPPQQWPMPLGCLPRARPNSTFLWYLKYGTLQYVVMQPFCMLITIVTTVFDAYGDGEFNWDKAYGYVAFIQNATQIIALYALAWLYLLLKQELAPFKPIPKFLVVKAVVFFTFWQAVGLAVLAHFGALKATEGFTAGEVQVGLQDFLVCVEMFCAACLHKYTFGHEAYEDGTFLLLMEQRRQGFNLPSGNMRLRVVQHTDEGTRTWEPAGPGGIDDTREVFTLELDEPDGIPSALFDENAAEIGAVIEEEDDDEARLGEPMELHASDSSYGGDLGDMLMMEEDEHAAQQQVAHTHGATAGHVSTASATTAKSRPPLASTSASNGLLEPAQAEDVEMALTTSDFRRPAATEDDRLDF